MTVQERIRLCKVLELMNQQPEFAKEVGLTDASVFQGKQVRRINVINGPGDREICYNYR